MSSRDHQELNNPGQDGQEFEPFTLDVGGPAQPAGSLSSSGQFSGVEMEFEPFMFNPGEVANAAAPPAPAAASAPAPKLAPEPAAASSPVPVTGHSVPPPSYLTADALDSRPQPEVAPGQPNGSAHPAHPVSSPDLSSVMMGRSRGNTGPLAAERLGATPTSWSDSSLASIEDFSAVLIAVQAGRKLLQSGPLRAALPSPVSSGAQAQALSSTATMDQPQGMAAEQVPQWAAQPTPSAATAAAPSETPPPFIAGADPSSPWAMDQPEWASGESHAPAPSAAPAAEDDAGLPPWLIEEDKSASSPAPEMAARQAEERPELVSSTFTGTTGVGIQAPESTLGEPALETGEEVAGALQTMDEAQPSGLDGEAIEFEGFMFDQGTPAPIPNLRGESGVLTSGPVAPFNPPKGGPEGMVVDQDAHVEGESLPFWLNDAAQVEVTPGQGYVEAADAAARASEPLKMESVTPADDVEDDFADLPPVQPFDFAQIAGAAEEESLGFNTEELIGMSGGQRDSMVVTANLEALADLIGGPLPPDIDPRQHRGPVASAAPAGAGAGNVAADPQAGAASEADDAEEFDVEPFEAEDMSWMSTVTTDLAASGLVIEPASAMPAIPAIPTSQHDLVSLSGELGVSPFDINELDVEEESSTSLLDQTPTVGPNTDKLELKQVWNGPPTSPRMDEEYVGDDAETATSIFAGAINELDEQYEEGDAPTSRLTTPEGAAVATPEAPEGPQASPAEETASPAPEQPEAGFFKARVARGPWSSNVPLVSPRATAAEVEQEAPQNPWAGGQTGMRAVADTPAETQEQPPAQAQPPAEPPMQAQPQAQPPMQAQPQAEPPMQAQPQATAPEPEQTFQMPGPGDFTVSGPLPVLTGYEDLVALMEQNPQDTGSYMAMATAYVNAGELESGLRVYRRLIKLPGVSATLLGMIDEELEDLRAGAGDLPRYHQVRGDLYLKLGRHREAIDEYNKLV